MIEINLKINDFFENTINLGIIIIESFFKNLNEYHKKDILNIFYSFFMKINVNDKEKLKLKFYEFFLIGMILDTKLTNEFLINLGNRILNNIILDIPYIQFKISSFHRKVIFKK